MTSAHADSAAANVDEVIVTGARGRPRTVADSPSPIDVISAAQLQESGKVSLKEALAVALPSFNFGTVNGFAHNNVVRPVSMRGLGSAYTLVLVNGKRRHPTSLLSNSQLDTSGATPVDVDQIPISAVERIEVLRDGAAAQYGSDAIAGVINIILKSSPQGGSAVASAGRNFAGDGDTAQLSADWGAKVGAGSLHLALDAKYQNRTDRNDLATGAFYFPVNGQPDPREATDPRRADYNGNPVVRAVTLSANYETPVADATFYTFATGGARSGNARMTRRRPNANNNIPEIFPNGYIPVYYLDERDFEVVSGVRGAAVGWNWDLSTGYGRNHTDSRADTLNPSLGPASPTHFELYTLASGVWTTNLDARREVGIGLGSPLQLAGGLEYRRETYRVEAGDAASYVDGGYRYTSGPLAGQPALIGVQGVNAVDAGDAGRASRSNLAAYVDLGLDVTKAWYLGLAARAEHYDDSAGDTVSWKLTTRYAVTPTLAFRGTASTGFRAPSLSQQLYGQRRYTTQIVAGQLQQFSTKVVGVNSPLAAALGATPLTPEQSVNYSVGVAYNPAPSFNVTLDAYQISIDDRIALTSTLSGAGVNALLRAAGLPTDIFVQYFTNAIDTRTRGVDLVGEYRLNLGDLGRLRLSTAFNWNKTEIRKIRPNPPQLATLGANLVLFDRVQQGSLTVGYPHTKLILGADWSIGSFDISLRTTRYGKVTQIAAAAADDRTFGGKWISDLDISYDFTPKVTLSFGANNIFNQYPDAVGIRSANGGGKYGTFSPFGITGGYYYTRIAYRF